MVHGEEDSFLLLNADSIFDVNFERLIQINIKCGRFLFLPHKDRMTDLWSYYKAIVNKKLIRYSLSLGEVCITSV